MKRFEAVLTVVVLVFVVALIVKGLDVILRH
jgi:hypothetical protein